MSFNLNQFSFLKAAKKKTLLRNHQTCRPQQVFLASVHPTQPLEYSPVPPAALKFMDNIT